MAIRLPSASDEPREARLEAQLDETAFGATEQAGSLRLEVELMRRKLQPLVRDQELSRFTL